MTLLIPKTFLWNTTVWNPSMISTALWLDAADSSTITSSGSPALVDTWRDKSGNNRNALASGLERPTYSATSFNSKPGLSFEGTNNAMIHLLNTANFIFIVFKVDTFQAGFRGLFATDNTMLLARTTNSAFLSSFGSADIPSATAYSNGSFYIFGLEDNQSGSGTKTFWINGASSGAFTADPTGQSPRHIGGIAGQRSAVTFAEIIALALIPDTTTRERLEGYLAQKWGLDGNLPSNHPYKNFGPKP